MRLSEALERLRQHNVDVVNEWEIKGRRGVTLGDPRKYFPYPSGPQYTIDITEDKNPELDPQEIDALQRRFGDF